MYEVFDHFIANDTWSSGHDGDLKRFFIALHKVINLAGFNPDELGNYLRAKRGYEDDNPMGEEVDYYVTKAWAVYDYLQFNGLRHGG